jgi:hypothetical protein
VPASVIDLMVALSYPRTFQVHAGAPEPQPQQQRAWRPTPASYADECIDPFYPYVRYRGGCDPFYSSRYGYGYYGYNRYGYSPWGYSSYGWNYGGQPVVVIVRPEDGQPRTPGSIVRGQGYTRGDASSSGQAQPRTAQPSGSGAASSRPATTTTTSGSGTTTSSGTTTTSGSTGRTAVPRPPGGEERPDGKQ